MKLIKKHWIPIIIILITILRIALSSFLPSYYIANLHYDDKLMVDQLKSLLSGDYLGGYSKFTLIKGIFFPLCLFYAKTLHVSFSLFFTIFYILASLFFVNSLKKITTNKLLLLITYIIILFNPVTYSAELFQRLYCNTISITELLFFLGLIINIIYSKEKNIFNYIFLGITITTMILTRNDNIWIYLILIIMIIIKIYKERKISSLLFALIPFAILFLNLNFLSLINYNKYYIYTYNELEKSNFKEFYKKVLQVKETKKKDKVSVTKETFYKLCDNIKSLNCNRKFIDNYYIGIKDENKEIDNGNIIWFIRHVIYTENKLKNGKEANDYFKKLSKEMDDAFKSKKLEKEMVLPSVFMNTPTTNEIKSFPKYVIEAIYYTATYKNVRTYSKKELLKLDKIKYDKEIGAYSFNYRKYRYAENVITKNILGFEIIRIIYAVFTIVFGIIAFIIYFKNIKQKDNLNIIIHIVLLIDIIILFGVLYTHVTAFHAIRYRYLSNVYILNCIFILLNLIRINTSKNREV